MKFYGSKGVYDAFPHHGSPYTAIIYRIPGGWGWESTVFNGSQSSGTARTLPEARQAVRDDYAIIADYLF